MKKKPKRKRRPTRSVGESLKIGEADVDRLYDAAIENFSARKFLSGLKQLDQIIAAGLATTRVWQQVGIGLNELEEFAQAKGALEKAILAEPDNPVTRFAMAQSCYELGECDVAMEHFRAVAEGQNDLAAWCNLATIAPGSPSESNQSIFGIRTRYAKEAIKATPRPVSGDLTESEGSLKKLRESSEAPLRVGFVSAYFHRENYMKPVWSLIRARDQQQVSYQLFADRAKDEQMAWFEPNPGEQVFDTTTLSNTELSQLIRSQELDVVVDLNAYSVPTRLPIYLERLAGCMVAWFNMYATSGFPNFDWIVGDPWVIPETEQASYTERIYRLPTSYLSFDVDYPAPEVVAPPCSSQRKFVFGSLISQYKITPEVIETWAAILRRIDAAELLLGNRALGSTVNRDYVTAQFERFGVDPERIRVVPPAPHRKFLEYYNQIDLALDAFPYNGGTTTTEAIWQGVPVLALDGDRWASRTSKTLLCNCHLGSFVAKSKSEYVELAVQWATNESKHQELKKLRSEMRAQLRSSPVCDRQQFARTFESALREMVESTNQN